MKPANDPLLSDDDVKKEMAALEITDLNQFLCFTAKLGRRSSQPCKHDASCTEETKHWHCVYHNHGTCKAGGIIVSKTDKAKRHLQALFKEYRRVSPHAALHTRLVAISPCATCNTMPVRPAARCLCDLQHDACATPSTMPHTLAISQH